MKKKYVKPVLTKAGKFEVVTQANGARNSTDALFPANTPFDQLTFS